MNMCMSIEGAAVRVLTFSGNKVDKWLDIPIESRWAMGGIVSEPHEIGKVLSAAVEENKMPKKGIVCALPSNGSSAQILSLPANIKKGQIKDLAMRELKRTSTAAALEGDYVYCYPMPKRADKQEVYVLTVPRTNVINLVDACKAAGVQLKDVELMPFALARAVGCKEGIVVHAEIDSVEVIIVADYKPAVFRSVAIRGAVDSEQACRAVLNELPRAVDYYNRTNLENPLSENAAVYLCGELAVDPELVMGVVEMTEREVASVDISVNCPPEFPQAKYMTQVGLMLKGKK